MVSFVSENCRRVGWRTENVGADARNRTWISPYITLRHPGRLALFCFPYTQLHPSTLPYNSSKLYHDSHPCPVRLPPGISYETFSIFIQSICTPSNIHIIEPSDPLHNGDYITLVKDTTCTRSWTATTSLPPPSSRPAQFPRCKR